MFRIRLLIAFLGLGCQAFAQLDRATLAGTVSDSSGAILAGAALDISSVDAGLRRAAVTGANGTYVFSLLPIGVYTLTASHSGFRTIAVKDVQLAVGDNRTLNLKMELSTV